jgi:hypothetical protein
MSALPQRSMPATNGTHGRFVLSSARYWDGLSSRTCAAPVPCSLPNTAGYPAQCRNHKKIFGYFNFLLQQGPLFQLLVVSFKF